MRIWIAAAALAAAAVAAAAKPAPATKTHALVPAVVPTVVLDKMVFGPAPKDLTVGQTLVFKNADAFQHSATAKGEFDLDLKPGKSGQVKLTHPGVIQVACRYHPTMKLALVVKPAGKGHR